MYINPLPPAPSRADPPETFVARADAFLAALAAFGEELNASISVANIAPWASGASYSVGAVVWSLVDFYPYRRIVAGAGATDPASDTVNWARYDFLDGGTY